MFHTIFHNYQLFINNLKIEMPILSCFSFNTFYKLNNYEVMVKNVVSPGTFNFREYVL